MEGMIRERQKKNNMHEKKSWNFSFKLEKKERE
jgi:hypothetical protein